MNNSKNLVLGISASIAVVKVPAIISFFQKRGFDIKVVLSTNSLHLISPSVLYALRVNEVLWEMFPEDLRCNPNHISLAEWGGLLLISPATASSICKIAYGFADNLLIATALCFEPDRIVIAPAMNWRMWKSAQVQKAVSILSSMGVKFVGPSEGSLACGEKGMGRLSEVEEIFSVCEVVLSERSK